MSSHFWHLQRIALVNLWSMLIGMGSALVVDIDATCNSAGISLVVLYEFLKRIWLASISLDTLNNALATYGAIIWYIVVHTRVCLRAEHTTVVHIATLINIYDVAVTVVEDEMAPAYTVHLASKLKVVEPTK